MQNKLGHRVRKIKIKPTQEAALDLLLKRGFRLFPVSASTKMQAWEGTGESSWTHRVWKRDELLRRMKKGQLPAYVPGEIGLCVLDVDEGALETSDGKIDQGVLDALQKITGAEPFGMVRSGKPGRFHLLYGKDRGEIKNGKWSAAGLSGDIRCTGGYLAIHHLEDYPALFKDGGSPSKKQMLAGDVLKAIRTSGSKTGKDATPETDTAAIEAFLARTIEDGLGVDDALKDAAFGALRSRDDDRLAKVKAHAIALWTTRSEDPMSPDAAAKKVSGAIERYRKKVDRANDCHNSKAPSAEELDEQVREMFGPFRYIEKTGGYFDVRRRETLSAGAVDHLVGGEFNRLRSPGKNRTDSATRFAAHRSLITAVSDVRYAPGLDAVYEEWGKRRANPWNPALLPADLPAELEEEDQRTVDLVGEIFRDHLSNLCGEKRVASVEDMDPRSRALLDVFLQYVQHPAERIEWMPLIVSEGKGIGKSILCQILIAVLGGNNVQEIGGEDILTNFTDWRTGAQVAFIDELFVERGKQEKFAGLMKKAITNKTVSVRLKFKRVETQINRQSYFAVSNHLAAISSHEQERRCLTFICRAPNPVEEPERFAAMFGRPKDEYFARMAFALSKPSYLRRWMLDAPQSADFKHNEMPKVGDAAVVTDVEMSEIPGADLVLDAISLQTERRGLPFENLIGDGWAHLESLKTKCAWESLRRSRAAAGLMPDIGEAEPRELEQQLAAEKKKFPLKMLRSVLKSAGYRSLETRPVFPKSWGFAPRPRLWVCKGFPETEFYGFLTELPTDPKDAFKSKIYTGLGVREAQDSDPVVLSPTSSASPSSAEMN